jgi:serine/threonine-protein kinase
MQPRKPEPGDDVGDRYIIERPLAEGGMGAVYVARHKTTDATVALKVLREPGSQPEIVRTRFVREAKVAAALGHPGIVKVFDAGEDPRFGPFLAMELLDGQPLDGFLESQNPGRPERLAIAREMLEALSAAHDAGIVHRDIKPENVFLAHDGEGGVRVKLLDFGVARVQAATAQTTDGTALGTIYYMAPEQMIDARNASAAADVWSVGVMLYEMLSGQLPFDGMSIHDVAVRVCTQDPIALQKHDPSIDPALAALVMSCLRREISERPENARALAQQLDAIGVQRVRATNVPAAPTSIAPPVRQSLASPPSIELTIESAPGLPPARSETFSGAAPPTAIDTARARSTAPKRTAIVASVIAAVALVGGVAFRLTNTRESPARSPIAAAAPEASSQRAVEPARIEAPRPIAPTVLEQPRVEAPVTAPVTEPAIPQVAPSRSAQRPRTTTGRVETATARSAGTTASSSTAEPAATVVVAAQPTPTPAPTALIAAQPTPAVITAAPRPAVVATTPTAPVQRPAVAPQPRRTPTPEPEVEAPLSF